MAISSNATLQLSSATPAGIANTTALGRVIYTDYVFLFQAAGLILMVAMIGAIVLTHRDRAGASLRQNVGRQQSRTVASTLEVMTVSLGANMREVGYLQPSPPAATAREHQDAKPLHAHPGEH